LNRGATLQTYSLKKMRITGTIRWRVEPQHRKQIEGDTTA